MRSKIHLKRNESLIKGYVLFKRVFGQPKECLDISISTLNNYHIQSLSHQGQERQVLALLLRYSN